MFLSSLIYPSSKSVRSPQYHLFTVVSIIFFSYCLGIIIILVVRLSGMALIFQSSVDISIILNVELVKT